VTSTKWSKTASPVVLQLSFPLLDYVLAGGIVQVAISGRILDLEDAKMGSNKIAKY